MSEPTRAKGYHKVWTIYRALSVPHEQAVESHNTELEEFLDAGYTICGSGMTTAYIYSIVSKRIINEAKTE